MTYGYLYYLILGVIIYNGSCFDPVSIAIGVGIAGLGYFLPSITKDNVICRLRHGECCSKPWLLHDINGLKKDLSQHVFGQHIAQQMVISALSAQLFSDTSKPLVMGFHGPPGTGKNYVVKFIADNMYEKGIESRFYHFFSGRFNFPSEDRLEYYQEQLRVWVMSNITLCAYSMFVFDEVEKMPSGILDGIKPLLDHQYHHRGGDFRKAVFIFLSNNGGNIITNKYIDLWHKYGMSRDEMSLNDFDSVIKLGAFNEKGGLERSDVIEHDLIDHYIPFLPLERSHIEQCIDIELKRYNATQHTKYIKGEVMKTIIFGPKPENIFATTGCKRIKSKISQLVEKIKLFREDQDRNRN